jgi:hypothetical protein
VVEATGMKLRPNDPNISKEIGNGSVIIVHMATTTKQKATDRATEEMTTSDSKKVGNNGSSSSIGYDKELLPLASSRQRDPVGGGAKRFDGKEETNDNDGNDKPAAQTSGELGSTMTTNNPGGIGTPSMRSPITSIARAMIQSDLRFEGSFPILEGNNLAFRRESVAGCSSFTETNCGYYNIAFDYKDAISLSTTFPNPWGKHHKNKERWLMAL